ncbi:hypothetical protein [Streptacidiphilus sp. MAP5-52]|uniref:hypothetical protein n=1 Tax=Streptacidiphilus sp. MAP5-52 TaxID=3156267 RepID=UPI003514938A
MAVKTRFDVTHLCGDTVEHDLSARPADQRAGYARWLSTRPCTDCWRSERAGDSAEREAWLANRRAKEQQDAAEWATRFRMPALDGPPKALAWGERTRHQLVSAAYLALVGDGDMDEEQWLTVEEQARTVDRAGWWIDQREADPADLPELLAAATESARTTENPF